MNTELNEQELKELEASVLRYLSKYPDVDEDEDESEPEEEDDGDDWYTRGCDLYHERKDDGYYD